jgi:hypothetical protein
MSNAVNGLIEKLSRAFKRHLKRGVKSAAKPIRKLTHREDSQGNIINIPREWLQKKQPSKINKTLITVKNGKPVIEPHRKVIHVPGLRAVKRGLASVLLLFNFIFSQYLITSMGFQVAALLFFGNCFICIDYLWKTRKITVEA